MKWMLKIKWLLLAVWVTSALALFFTMPSIDRLVREKGQPEIPDGYTSKVAADLLAEMNESGEDSKSLEAVIVFHDPKGLKQSQLDRIKHKLQQIEHSSVVKVTAFLNPFENEQAEEQLISKDKKTVMAVATIEKNNETTGQIRQKLSQEVKLEGIETYLTGNELITEDYAQTSIDGVKSTEIAAVLIIIAVLLIVFRSPVTPIISLLTVGITYLVSLGVVINLVEYADFPFANTTQIFLILVLFGIGTDYNILLFMRFKEELAKHKSITGAILETYKTAGKTVFYSGIAVFIGFAMLAFSQFGIYRSAVAVAVGILFLLLALFTVTPFFMAVLGNYLFWPSKKAAGHKESRLWSRLGHFSVQRVGLSLLSMGLIAIPAAFLYDGTLSFNSLKEVNPDFESVKGFNIVSDSFSPGRTLPTTVVVKNDQPLDSPEALAFLDTLHQRLAQIPGVDTVYGSTRPTGEPIDPLYVKNQTKDVNRGLDQSADGLNQISSGLSTAAEQIKVATNGDLSNVSRLVDGTSAVRGGLGEVQKALKQIHGGINRGADGATEISQGVDELDAGLGTLSVSMKKLSGGYMKLEDGFTELEKQYQGLETQIAGVENAANLIYGSAQNLEKNNPDLASDEHFVTIKRTSESLSQQLPLLRAGFAELNQNYSKALARLKEANSGLEQVIEGHEKLQAGAAQLKKGASDLENGLQHGTAGQGKVITSLEEINGGLRSIHDGQKELNKGLKQFESSLKELEKGLSQSSDGIDEISAGIGKANHYLAQVTGSQAPQTFFVPEEARTNEDFQAALDMYMSQDRTIAKWTISLDVDPYSETAMEIAKEIDDTIKQHLSHTDYQEMKAGTGGVSMMNHDLQTISSGDFFRTVVLMLIGIGLMLLLLFRSFWMMVFIMLSLVLAYFSSLAITEIFFVHGLNETGLSWTIPFFSFIMIIALGVDYSIFVMMRYKEYELQTPTIAILEAMKNIGGVVISAAIILCGTFAAMYPSGVTTLVQISTAVIIGLFLLAFVILPMLLPAAISLLDRQARKEKRI